MYTSSRLILPLSENKLLTLFSVWRLGGGGFTIEDSILSLERTSLFTNDKYETESITRRQAPTYLIPT